MFKCFYPGVRYDSVYAIDFNKYHELGYRGILFDIDNTLVMHDAPANDKAIQLFSELREIGFVTCLISNNDTPRTVPFAEAVGADYVCNAGKPKASGYEEAMRKLGLSKNETIMVGDQLFTDIRGANNAGIYPILTEKIARDPHFHIRLKRAGEAIVLFFYRFYEPRHGGEKYLRDYGKN